jgi:hypothetical protein
MSLPKYFTQEDSIKRIANKKEDIVYKHLLSGALSFKGDFSTKDSCIDNKSTKNKSISVTTKMCDKLLDDSLTMGKTNSILILDLPEYYIVGKVIKKASINK